MGINCDLDKLLPYWCLAADITLQITAHKLHQLIYQPIYNTIYGFIYKSIYYSIYVVIYQSFYQFSSMPLDWDPVSVLLLTEIM